MLYEFLDFDGHEKNNQELFNDPKSLIPTISKILFITKKTTETKRSVCLFQTNRISICSLKAKKPAKFQGFLHINKKIRKHTLVSLLEPINASLLAYKFFQ